MKFFTSEDFRGLHGHDNESMANVANEKLEREAKVVYGAINEGVEEFYSTQNDVDDTHRALLICVEELPKTCEHKPAPAIHMDVFSEKIIVDMNDIKCTKCEVKLKATWSVADD